MPNEPSQQPRRLRVLFISDVYFPRVNGVSTSIQTFRTDLAVAGVESVLVAPAYEVPGHSSTTESSEQGAFSVPDVSIVRVPSTRIPGDPEDRRMHFGPLRATLARLQARHFDLVHVQTPFLAHYAGVRFARRQGIPVVATYHTLFEEYLHYYVPLLPRRMGRALARRFTRSQCAQLSALIAPSEPMAQLLREYGVTARIEIIPTGLPAGCYRRGDGSRFREQFGIAADRRLLLYVGRVAHEKNLEFLLHAFVALRRARPDALFVIAGEGPARAHLQSLAGQLGIAQQVHFIGYLERTRGLIDCYAACDVFVFASNTETQGLVLLEALAQGRPVVSTARLGTASILRVGCGAHVAPERPDAFAEAVLDVLDDPARAAQLSAEGYAYAQSWASIKMARRLAELYAELGGLRTSALQLA